MLAVAERVRLDAALCADASAAALTTEELVRTLDALHEAEQLVRAAQAHVVREIEARRIPAMAHATSCSTWLRDHLRMDVYAAGSLVKQGRALADRPALNSALRHGAVNAAQASVIDEAVRDLPHELAPAAVDKAEAILIDWAGELEPRQLRKHALRVLDHVAPELAHATTEENLKRQQEHAYERRTLKIYPIAYGRVRINGVLDNESAAIVTAALEPLCRPTAEGPAGYDQRRADALVEVCRRALRDGDLPAAGGEPPQVVVTVPYDVVTRSLGAGVTDSGAAITAEAARRLACDARIVPAVLGGQGQVLDLGRSRRLISGPLHRALVLRDCGCAFPGCDRPPRCSGAHHLNIRPTSPRPSCDLVLLCRGPTNTWCVPIAVVRRVTVRVRLQVPAGQHQVRVAEPVDAGTLPVGPSVGAGAGWCGAVALEKRHPVPGAGEQDGSRQAGESGADDDGIEELPMGEVIHGREDPRTGARLPGHSVLTSHPPARTPVDRPRPPTGPRSAAGERGQGADGRC